MNGYLAKIKETIVPILKKYGARKAGIFGSVVREDFNDESDIDILVDIEKDINLLDFIGLKLEIEDALGKKIDLVEYDTIKIALKNSILEEQIEIL